MSAKRSDLSDIKFSMRTLCMKLTAYRTKSGIFGQTAKSRDCSEIVCFIF